MSLTLETVPVGALVLDPANARKHGSRNLDAIAGSLRQFGQRRPLVCRRAGGETMVIAGNGTLEAARSLGWTEVVITVVPDDWTSEQAKAYALADNRTAELATWDEAVLAEQLTDLDALGFDLNSIGFDGLPALDLDAGADDVGEVPLDPVSSPGDLWVCGPHRVICGSSTDAAAVGRLFADEFCQCIITDPPYGVSYVDSLDKTMRDQGKVPPRHRAIAGDDVSDAVLEALVKDSLALAFAHAAEGAGAYVFHADSKRLVFEGAMSRAGFLCHQTLVWVKQRITLGHMDYLSQHEPVLYGWKQGGKHGWYGGRRRSALVADEAPNLEAMTGDEAIELLQALYAETSVIRHDRPAKSTEHPTMKPVGLLARFVVNSTKKGELVYDPFLGSGSTLIAAETQGRRCVGCELDPGYVDVIVQRWEKATGGKAVLDRGEG
jgi:DNA modification methylase